MFKANCKEVLDSAGTVEKVSATLDDTASNARKKNIETLRGQTGTWAQQAESTYSKADVNLSAAKTALSALSTQYTNVANALNEKLRPLRDQLLDAIGTSANEAALIQCEYQTNVAPLLAQASDDAWALFNAAETCSDEAEGLDGNGLERQAILDVLEEIKTSGHSQRTKYDDIAAAWHSFSTAVMDFDNQYATVFSGEFVTKSQLEFARQDTATMLVENFVLSGYADADGEFKTMYSELISKGEISVDADGKLSVKGTAEASYIFAHLSGEAKAGFTLLGINSEASASGEVEVLMTASASGEISHSGVSGDVSALVGVKAAGDVALVAGNNLPLNGAELSAHGEGQAGAMVNAHAGLGKTKEGAIEAKASGEAFAGGKASGSITNRVGPFEVTGEASVSAGAGISGDAGVSFQDGKLTVVLGASATLGIGAGAKVSGSIDFGSIEQESVNFFGHFFQ